MAIPLLAKGRDSKRFDQVNRALRACISAEHMTFDETLRVFSNVLFYSRRHRRDRIIEWLAELLQDLRDTRAKHYAADSKDLWGEDSN